MDVEDAPSDWWWARIDVKKPPCFDGRIRASPSITMRILLKFNTISTRMAQQLLRRILPSRSLKVALSAIEHRCRESVVI